MPGHDVCWLKSQQHDLFLCSLICWLRAKNKDSLSMTNMHSFFQCRAFMTYISTNFLYVGLSVLEHQPAFRFPSLLSPPFITPHISPFSLSISSSSSFLIFSPLSPLRPAPSCAYTYSFNVLAALCCDVV